MDLPILFIVILSQYFVEGHPNHPECPSNLEGPNCQTLVCPIRDFPICSSEFGKFICQDVNITICPHRCGICPNNCTKQCQNGGIQNSLPCICECIPGFTGEFCEIPMLIVGPPCVSHCLHGGVFDHTTDTCLCHPSGLFTGDRCQHVNCDGRKDREFCQSLGGSWICTSPLLAPECPITCGICTVQPITPSMTTTTSTPTTTRTTSSTTTTTTTTTTTATTFTTPMTTTATSVTTAVPPPPSNPCPSPPNVANADVIVVGHVAYYTCRSGYNQTGRPTTASAACLSDGSWTRPGLFCADAATIVQPCANICQHSGILNPVTQICTCHPSGLYTGDKCQTVNCTGRQDKHFCYLSEKARICGNAFMSPACPELCGICQTVTPSTTPTPSIVCAAPPSIANAQVAVYGNTAVYTCNHGYTQLGGQAMGISTCLSTGAWTPTNMTCSATVPPTTPTPSIPCAAPPSIANAQVAVYGNTAVYTCNQGYTQLGGQAMGISTCLSTGTWTSTNMICSATVPSTTPTPSIPCAAPPSIANAQVAVYGNTAVYTCNQGYTQNGWQSTCISTCMPTGAWTHINMICNIIAITTTPFPCPSPPNIANAQVAVYGNTAVYTCNSGYAPSGGESTWISSCMTGGIWTQSNKTCSASNGCFTMDMRRMIYRGTMAVTQSGRTCQRWDLRYPNRHSIRSSHFRNSNFTETVSEAANYCRDPAGRRRRPAGRLWCYNGEGRQPRWEWCAAVPHC